VHVQIVKFKLRPDASQEAFLALTKQMIAWLKDREGFVAYELYKGSESWLDRIAWESETHAQAGLNEFLATAIAKQMISLVESDYSSFFGEAIASA
jgi:quinol monooxygenase YgiN